MKISKKQNRIITYELRQDRDDKDYGSCLWARFNLDLDNYTLMIVSDCGDYSYGWIPTPGHESFLKLLSRMDKDYLLNKIARKTIIDEDETCRSFVDLLESAFEEDHIDGELMDSINDACNYDTKDQVVQGLRDAIVMTCYDSEIDDYDIWGCVCMTETPGAKRIVQIFEDYVQPAIRKELEKEESDGH